jgi:hypothetical protein
MLSWDGMCVLCVCMCTFMQASLVISVCICLLIPTKAMVRIKVPAYCIATCSLNAHIRVYEVTV